MPLEIRPMVDTDFPGLVHLYNAAFDDGGGITSLITPKPIPLGYVEKQTEKHLKSAHEEKDVTYLKVVDTDLGDKMIAAAKWRINKKERTEQQIENTLPVPGKDEEGRPGAQDFMWFLNRVRREYMGTKPFYMLHILVTDPEHHRRGAGAMLITWGLDQADDAQLPAFLESSPMGRPLYKRMGFEPVYEELWDLTKYGLEGTDVSTVMIRSPLHYVM